MNPTEPRLEDIQNSKTHFWTKVRKGKKSGSCWMWTAYTAPFGHGYLRVGSKTMPAHRVSWALHFGEIPDGLCVCHSCDVPGCVNPEHLFLGTKSENTRDRDAKGRTATGVRQGSVKLSEAQVLEIRAHHEEYGNQRNPKKPGGMSLRELGAEYGVAHSAICRIVHRKKWKCL